MEKSEILPELPSENRLLYDWVSITTRKHTVYDLVKLLKLEELPFVTVHGSKGFIYRQYFDGISIHFNEASLEGIGEFIWLEMSGQGCRNFESYGSGNYEELFRLALDDPTNVHITRLDVAFDDFTGVFDIDTICEKTRKEEYVSRIHNYLSIYSNKGNSVQFGSRLSKILIRIYDKAAERGYDNTRCHWVRCELQIKDNNALGFVEQLQHSSIQDAYYGVMKNYLSFREPTADSNKRRWPESYFWTKFLGSAIRLSIFVKPGAEYNLSACERYVFKQPIGSIKTLIEIYGGEAFLEMVEKAPPAKNPKYKQLVAQAAMEERTRSKGAMLDRWIELVDGHDLEALAELREGYRELHAQAKLHYEEKKEELRRHDEYLFRQRIRAELARDNPNLYKSEVNKSCDGAEAGTGPGKDEM